MREEIVQSINKVKVSDEIKSQIFENIMEKANNENVVELFPVKKRMLPKLLVASFVAVFVGVAVLQSGIFKTQDVVSPMMQTRSIENEGETAIGELSQDPILLWNENTTDIENLELINYSFDGYCLCLEFDKSLNVEQEYEILDYYKNYFDVIEIVIN